MPPTKEACQIYVDAQTAKAKILKQWFNIRDAIQKLLSTKIKLQFGILNIADVIGAEVLSAVETLAASIAQAALGALSQAATAVVETVLKELLKILLAFPTAVFSLVAIPLNQARVSCNNERLYLIKASNNIRAVLGLIIKWTGGQAGDQYYQKMVEAMPYITKALSLIKDMIVQLQGETSDEATPRNAVFNEEKFFELQHNLRAAINITMPTSVIEDNLQITATVEQNRLDIYKELSENIKKEYARKRSDISTKFSKDMDGAEGFNGLARAIRKEQVKSDYSTQLNMLSMWKKEQLANAQMKATIQSASNGSNYVQALSGFADAFMYDMKFLMSNLNDFHQNMVMAYTNYKMSQLMCNSIYNIRELIRGLINEIINLIRESSNVAGTAVIQSLAVSQAMMEIVYETFSKDIERFNSSDSNISSIELSQALFLDNQLLAAADANINATITDSLIKLINSDDLLKDEAGQFDAFLNRIKNIPDWDGTLGVWAVDMLHISVSPYVQVIADSVNLLTSVPTLSISKRGSDQQTIRKLLVRVENSFAAIKKHNTLVYNVLYSYEPYVGSEAGNLMKMLAGTGLLQNFALGMSIAGLVTTIGANVATRGFGSVFPSNSACRKLYPELFTDADLNLAAAKEALNVQSAELSNDFNAWLEKNKFNINKQRLDVSTFELYPSDLPWDAYNNADAEPVT